LACRSNFEFFPTLDCIRSFTHFFNALKSPSLGVIFRTSEGGSFYFFFGARLCPFPDLEGSRPRSRRLLRSECSLKIFFGSLRSRSDSQLVQSPYTRVGFVLFARTYEASRGVPTGLLSDPPLRILLRNIYSPRPFSFLLLGVPDLRPNSTSFSTSPGLLGGPRPPTSL